MPLQPGQNFDRLDPAALAEEHAPVTCEGVLLQKGAQITDAEGKLYDSQRRLIAYGSETCMLRALGGSRA